MNKRGIVLVFGLLVLLVLFIIFGGFFIKVINENNLASRYLNSTRALWAAEAGVAEAKKNFPNSPLSGNIGNCSYATITSSSPRATIDPYKYYDLTSIGTVDLTGGGQVQRTINAVIRSKYVSLDPTKFQYAMQAANDLCFGGNCSKPAENYLDPDVCNGHACWKENDTSINFGDLFGYEQSEVEAMADHTYTEADFPASVSGISWVNVTPGSELSVGSSSTGSGLLIINGNARFEGSYTFNGIVYVLGTLTLRGTFNLFGSIIVANTAGVDTINGTPDLSWNQEQIGTALNNLSDKYTETAIVSWSEG